MKQETPIAFDREKLNEYDKDGILILTAISKPKRLYKFLPRNYKMLNFSDHSYFDYKLLKETIAKHNIKYLMVTSKDLVKLSIATLKNIKVILIDLELKLNSDIQLKIDSIINQSK